MAGNKTLTIIKPYAVQRGLIIPILEKIHNAGFRVSAMKLIQMTKQEAESFYDIHKDKHFFNDLTNFMSSGRIVAAILEKENAVEDYRKLIGDADPKKSAEGTIRNLYAASIEKNAVHGSDSDENAERECNFFFSMIERF